MAKLDLDWELVKEARESAKKIAADSQVFIDAHSTVTVERTICILLGIDGVDEFGVPLPNVVVDFIKDNGNISLGVAKYIGNAMIETKLQPQEIAEKIKQLNAQSYIHFKGHQDLQTRFKAYELYLATSAWETFGLTLLAAIGSGFVMVGTDVP